MKTSEKEAVRWIRQSEDDFKFVQWVLSENAYFDKGCFIAQQAGEKALKACLYALGRRSVIGHSLFELSNELSQKDSRFSPLMDAAKQLDLFSFQRGIRMAYQVAARFRCSTARILKRRWMRLSR